jgi:hypothetical protein
MAIETRKGTDYALPSPGPFLAKIVNHLDPTYMGTVEVQLLHESGNDPDSEMQLHQVKYLSPFIGQTSLVHVDSGNDDYNSTQKSYGFWMIPPDVGVIVMVIFVDGDPRKGYCMGCIPDLNMNYMIPGNAATEFATSKETDAERVPVAEYNKLIHSTTQDPTKIEKPATPFEKVLDEQGLLKDDIRGITTSSARREVPSAVFGISTPGPVDKQSGAKKGPIGVGESKIDQAFVSRLGGSSFVMDDGDDKFIRKKKAFEGPPEYSSVEQGETDGEKTIPHNELIRLRTRTGHQILLHNSEDLIYISNARGTAWIEITSDGKIDIFSSDSISLRTKQDFNFYADRDINLESGRNINIKANEEMYVNVVKDATTIIEGDSKTHVKGNVHLTIDKDQKVKIKENLDHTVKKNYKQTIEENFDLKTTKNNKFTAGENTDILSGGNHTETATRIDMNGPAAAEASAATEPTITEFLTEYKLPDLEKPGIEEEIVEKITILRRLPTPEPYPQHENLDPETYKSKEIDRDKDDRFASSSENEKDPPIEDLKEPAELWKEYSTSTDTFAKEFSGD